MPDFASEIIRFDATRVVGFGINAGGLEIS